MTAALQATEAYVQKCKFEFVNEDGVTKSGMARIGIKTVLANGATVSYHFRSRRFRVVSAAGRRSDSLSYRQLKDRFSPAIVQAAADGLEMALSME